jgi:hypothetical protein
MSNSLSIAAVTAAIKSLLLREVPKVDTALSDLEVTTMPLDKAREGVTKTQLNVDLYHVAVNAARRNQEPPTARPGEKAYPALPLTLHFLLTAWGRTDRDPDGYGHRAFGAALAVLHDHPLLDPQELKDALAGSDLYAQRERVRLTFMPMNLEELSKLWTGFATNQRLSMALEVSVVLLDSRRQAQIAPPVLRRGPDDQGVQSQPNLDLDLPIPQVDAVVYPNGQTCAFLGDTIELQGRHLAGTLVLRWSHPLLGGSPTVTVLSQTDGSIKLQLPGPGDSGAATWVNGLLGLQLRLTQAGRTLDSNPVSVLLGPTITTPMPMAVTRDGAGKATFNLSFAPQVRAEQSLSLLVGSQELKVPAHSVPLSGATFVWPGAPSGPFLLRLRADGLDSRFLDCSTTPATFLPSASVTLS